MAGSTTLSVILSAEEKAKQDNHDLEVCLGDELDLQKHFHGCKKNPGHLEFIPCSSLKVLHLVNARLPDVLKLKKFCDHVIKLTVKLKVKYVSSQRLKVKQYPLSEYAGQRISSYGSGCVTDIDLSGDKGSFPCPLKNCPHSKEPHQVYGNIIITTAAHVVFDDDEAKETIVEFFDDDSQDKTKLKTAHGVKVRHVSVHGDKCELMCFVHSNLLFEEFSQMVSPCPTHPAIFQFIDDSECRPSFLSLLSALADIRDCCIHYDNCRELRAIFSTVEYEIEKVAQYGNLKDIVADTEVTAFLLEAEQVTREEGLMGKVLELLISNTFNCSCSNSTEVIENVTILGVVNLISEARQRHNFQTFVPYFFSQIVDCLNHVTHLKYHNTQAQHKSVLHVSHPHGQSKQVSFGQHFYVSESDELRKHIYKAPSCNGCSGGPVWILPTGEDGKILWNQVYGVPHKGCLDKSDKLNHSCSVEFSVPHLQKLCERLQIRLFKHLQNIRHYQHLMNIGPDPQTVICYSDTQARWPYSQSPIVESVTPAFGNSPTLLGHLFPSVEPMRKGSLPTHSGRCVSLKVESQQVSVFSPHDHDLDFGPISFISPHDHVLDFEPISMISPLIHKLDFGPISVTSPHDHDLDFVPVSVISPHDDDLDFVPVSVISPHDDDLDPLPVSVSVISPHDHDLDLVPVSESVISPYDDDLDPLPVPVSVISPYDDDLDPLPVPVSVISPYDHDLDLLPVSEISDADIQA